VKHLLDTNVISELAARRPDRGVIRRLDRLDPAGVYLSVITIGELCKGIEKLPESGRRTEFGRWLRDELMIRFHNRILPLDVNAMLKWGELVGRLELEGRTMAAVDSFIAAIALSNSCILVTRNESDFVNAGVEILNPWK
jgi:predicted nucleic acid-binding protein